MWMEFQVLAQRLGTEAKHELEGHNFGRLNCTFGPCTPSSPSIGILLCHSQLPWCQRKCGNSGGLGTFISLAGMLDTVNLGISGQHGFAAAVPLAVSKPPARSCHWLFQVQWLCLKQVRLKTSQNNGVGSSHGQVWCYSQSIFSGCSLGMVLKPMTHINDPAAMQAWLKACRSSGNQPSPHLWVDAQLYPQFHLFITRKMID